MKNTILKDVTKTLDGKVCNRIDVDLQFIGTYGRKRKIERQSLKLATLEDMDAIAMMDDDALLHAMKGAVKRAIPEHKIKLSQGDYVVRLNAWHAEYDSGYLIRCSDSNLMIKAPRLVFKGSDL